MGFMTLFLLCGQHVAMVRRVVCVLDVFEYVFHRVRHREKEEEGEEPRSKWFFSFFFLLFLCLKLGDLGPASNLVHFF